MTDSDTGSDWSFGALAKYDTEIARIADSYGLDTYTNQIEIISSEQMLDAYASNGMPMNYTHWSFGKQFLLAQQNYQSGHMGLAYELVINSDPCISYLMEENSLAMQVLVMAHACYGHNSFFKGNYLFQTWTDAQGVIDYLAFAKSYIARCEERFGIEAVEATLDACHALAPQGIDRYKRPDPLSARQERENQQQREAHVQRMVNDLWIKTIPGHSKTEPSQSVRRYPEEPQENLLYFLEKSAPLLEPWQREIVRIVRKMAQYFYPQQQTKLMNEGWATFWHYHLLFDLYDQGIVDEGMIMECLHSHSSVVFQPPFDHPACNGLNPYGLGFEMFCDIRRICEEPTEEDMQWFPDFAGSSWLETLKHAMHCYKDESFILQFLSPAVIRKFRMFMVKDDDRQEYLEVGAIHDEAGYRQIREMLAEQYNSASRDPEISVYDVDIFGNRRLTLRHNQVDRHSLSAQTGDVVNYLKFLWGFDVRIESWREQELVKTWTAEAS